MKDSIGDRMKDFYEDRTRYKLQRRSYNIIRIDGKSFHTYTKGLKRPFDRDLIEDMDETAMYLCKNIMGAKFAYVQSDEISILFTDFDELDTEMWFDGNIQKMVSVSASLATSKFNSLRTMRFFNSRLIENIGSDHVPLLLDSDGFDKMKLAHFDSRIFQISNSIEVENYFIWRQQDATRNSISSVAQSLYSHRELEKKSSEDKQEMIFKKGINWNNYSFREKRGGIICTVPEYWMKKKGTREPGNNVSAEVALMHKEEMEKNTEAYPYEIYERNSWKKVETPIFTQNRDFLRKMIPTFI